MAGSRRERMIAAIQRVLDEDERIVGQGRCWAAVRRPHVPLLFLGRHQYEAFLTDRRLILISRRRRRLSPTDVVLVKRFPALALVEEHRRPTLLQQRITTDTATVIVLEWPHRSRRLGLALSDELERTPRSEAA